MEDNTQEEEIIHRTLDTDGDNPAIQIVELVAEIEDRDMLDLANMYDCADGILDHLFSDPPASEAQMQVMFSYEGYRITIEQNGAVKLVKTA